MSGAPIGAPHQRVSPNYQQLVLLVKYQRHIILRTYIARPDR